MVRKKSSAEPALEKPWLEAKRVLLEGMRVAGRERMKEHYEPQRAHVAEMIRRTATAGESNSALLIGSRGCGKTTLLEMVLEELFRDKHVRDNLQRVNLNGKIAQSSFGNRVVGEIVVDKPTATDG
ncbi:PREDICTED: origin recognition complex subunit 4-like [Priapulus caudatus]|uniref:Origin recognition complex subunit 4-like n=1 Tax=Priapulus caudatus TaxID=37621 RepID=A0ABM1EQD0_PRICU|nr:PREDICTED: origin recognition complex subunit 4-like [Priapulus caudatus]